jgi:hypothetical protein
LWKTSISVSPLLRWLNSQASFCRAFPAATSAHHRAHRAAARIPK